MTRSLRTGLLGGASALALVAAAISPASAFDKVNWEWEAHIDEDIIKTVDIDIDLEPTGLVMVQDLQVSIGNISATSTVTGVDNNQPGGGLVLGEQDFQWHYGLGGGVNDDGFQSPEIVDAFVDETDPDQNDFPGANGTATVTIDLGELSDAEFDAVTELPEVVSSATAVANNASITSEVAVELHEGQFGFNVPGSQQQGNLGVPLQFIPDENTNLGGAAVLTWYALNGATTAASVTASSNVSNILNASVDSNATAVTNNMAIDVDAVTADDALVMADIVQFSHANVNANSSVSGVSLNNYTNLGLDKDAIGRPIVSSVAAAIGNNKNITVQTPDLP